VAIEAAIMLGRARTGRPIILSADGSFHGKTLGALAATGQPHHAAGFGPLPGGFERVPFGDAAALAGRLARDGDRIAAFFVEPVQGERGVHLPPAGYLRRARELCSRYGVPLVVDEIQTGLGRTGRLFACEHEGVAPDVLLVAKALGGGLFPLGACLASAAVWDDTFALRHSSTFANNNVACRVGLAVLEALTAGGLAEAAARKGARLQAGLADLARRYPDTIAAVRGVGLLTAIELRGPDRGAGGVLSFLDHQGLHAYAVAATLAETASVLVLPALGDAHVLRVTPPLVVSDDELDLAVARLGDVCRRLEANAVETIVRGIGALDEGPSVAPDDASRPAGLPPARSANEPRPAYAFLVHLTEPDDVAAADPGLATLTAVERRRLCAFTSALPAGVVMAAPTIRSRTGAVADGIVIALPLLPEQMARRGLRRMSEEIAHAVDLAARLGVRRVGLGGYTAPYSRRGLAVVGRGPAITTGNTLTAGMAVAATIRTGRALCLALGDARVAIVGARGSVGALCARLIARERPRGLVLVGNPATGVAGLEHLRRELARDGNRVAVTTGLSALADCDVVITATAAARAVLDDAPLTPGTLVCDVAQPPDASARLRGRPDLTVIDGGHVALPDPRVRFGPSNLRHLPDGVQLACLAETILLTLEHDPRDWGVGDNVPVGDVDRLMALATRHGFRLAPPAPTDSRGAPVPSRHGGRDHADRLFDLTLG
jgi:acetylornithine/succinyldiaminopimelate/putrescine aminotransferase/predicted amino acid dehydrogenase